MRPFGDGAVVVDMDSVEEAHATAASLDDLDQPGIEDVIVGYRSVTVVADPTVTDVPLLVDMLGSRQPAEPAESLGRLIEIPVALDGGDLDEVARMAGMTPQRVVALLTSAQLRVAFVGFAPGFAYLVGLDPDLAAIARRATPRPAVPAGSVGLAGGFVGIYPQTSPGGWHLVGRTDMQLFDPSAPPYSALRAGDRVRLCLTTLEQATETDPMPGLRPPLASEAERRLVVEDAGLLSFVQDRGRLGWARLGVPRAGAADPYALRMANRLVGNDEGGAAIEITAHGPALRFTAPAYVAVAGLADVRVNGRSVPTSTVVPVDAGQTMTTGTPGGMRGYIAVGGGIETPTILGSRSSDVLCGLGIGPLRRGDTLGIGPPVRPRGQARHGSGPGDTAILRVVAGPDAFPPATVERLLSTTWEVDPSSNRVGVRFRGAPIPGVALPDAGSRGMITGAIQLPPDGRPIALLCDHATVGGYPVIATVASADLGVLGQLRPGDAVRLEPVDLVEAARARAGCEREIGEGVAGWYPVRTD
ncbi:MAG TPA: 5-oxoprolinase/urea amidolyase family protein [Acidimicrobiales bacterium]|nr:5-oxoprolinase/urea amidolyase family protein [Acidimicrobiales bacterium]